MFRWYNCTFVVRKFVSFHSLELKFAKWNSSGVQNASNATNLHRNNSKIWYFCTQHFHCIVVLYSDMSGVCSVCVCVGVSEYVHLVLCETEHTSPSRPLFCWVCVWVYDRGGAGVVYIGGVGGFLLVRTIHPSDVLSSIAICPKCIASASLLLLTLFATQYFKALENKLENKCFVSY